MSKTMEKFITILINLVLGFGALFLLQHFTGTPVNDLVGWFALGWAVQNGVK